MAVVNWFVNNILGLPEFFIGLLVLIGYVLLKKRWYESITGMLKAIVGYMLLNIGAGGLVSTFRPILAGLKDRFHLHAAVIDPYFALSGVDHALKSIGVSVSWTMTAMLIGFIVNILLVMFRKWTKVRSLFITGHIMVQTSTVITWLVFFAMPQYRNIWGALMVGILSGLYWGVGSNLTVGVTQDLTNQAGFAVGHQQMFAIWASSKIAPKLGNKEKNLGNLKLPGWLSMFEDSIVSTSVLMIIFFGIIMTVLGKNMMMKLDPAGFAGGISFPVYVIHESLFFTVYLQVLMSGVRMFVAELTNSFQGISNKILPGAMPAVDVATTYPFAPNNAVLFGFILGAIGQFVAILGLLVFHSPILVITGFVPVFFDNAAVAIFADHFGGRRAAAILSFAAGLIEVLVGAFALMFFKLFAFGGWEGSLDFELFWPWVGVVLKVLKVVGFALVVIFLLAIPQLQYHFAKDKEAYDQGKI